MQERKKKYMLKVDILGVKIYICNLNLKPYMRHSTTVAQISKRSQDARFMKVRGANVNTVAAK